MTRARLVITAVTLEGRPVAEVAAAYGISRSWIYELLARYKNEGEAAFTPRSKRPHTSPTATPPAIVDAILHTRATLTNTGLDAGADTIAWHLQHQGIQPLPSRATIHRILTRHEKITPEPHKKPRSAWHRFEADQPNELWQSDVTHYRLTTGTDTEIITWLDDHSRKILHISAHPTVTATIVLATFKQACHQHGSPASTLTDNGMIYTARLAGHGRRGGRTALERHLAITGITQKNGRPGHPTTQGKIERFHQTLKKWLRAHPQQPTTITALNTLLQTFTTTYNNQRPHRALAGRTPNAAYQSRPKAGPSGTTNPHERVRHDRLDTTGKVTLRIGGHLYKIGIGRTHARTPVILLVQDLNVRIIHATTGEILRELTIDPTRTYQPQNPKQKTAEPPNRGFDCP